MNRPDWQELRLRRNRAKLVDALIKLHEVADLLQPLTAPAGVWPADWPLSDRSQRHTKSVRDEVIVRAGELRMLLEILGSELAAEPEGGSSEGGGR